MAAFIWSIWSHNIDESNCKTWKFFGKRKFIGKLGNFLEIFSFEKTLWLKKFSAFLWR